MISYTSPDGRQVETVRVAISDLALRATGYIVCAGPHGYGATYSLVVDPEGCTRRVAVRSDDGDGERSLTLTRATDGPWIGEDITGSTPMTALNGALDVYLVGSAFAASLPIRRLGLHTGGGETAVTVASIALPSLEVSAVEHRGAFIGADDDGATIAYTGQFGSRDLRVDTDGVFLAADGLSRRVLP